MGNMQIKMFLNELVNRAS